MKLEYKKVVTDHLEIGINQLNELGQDGWELVEIISKNDKYTYYFKKYIE